MSSQCGCQSGQACTCQDEHCDCGGAGGSDTCACGGHSTHAVAYRPRTKAEHIAEMEAYLFALRAEIHAVEEHLSVLRQ